MRQPIKILLLFLGVLALGCGGGAPERLGLGSTVPDFELPALDGGVFESAAFDGQVTVVNFWATWCAPCQKEIPELQEIAAEGQVRVVGIALDEEGARAVAPFVEKHGISYPILLGNQEIFQQMGGFAIPYTLVLDGSRQVVNVYRGPASREDIRGDYERITGERITDERITDERITAGG